jgi:AAA domain
MDVDVSAALERAKMPYKEKANGIGAPEDDGYQPPGEARGSEPSRKMQIEWFDEAAEDALSETTDPLVDGLLDEGALSVIYGDSNSGKTFVALDMAFHVSAGLGWNDRRVKNGLVVYVAAEGGKRIKRRLAALKKRYREEFHAGAPPAFALVRFPIDLRSNDANLVELIRVVRAAATTAAKPCVWVIVDTLSRAMAGGDENSPVDMGRIVAAADRIRAETSAHFTYVHHTGKDAARGARGHSLLRAATDTEIEVTPQSMTVTKQRDMEGGLSLGFALVDLEIGVEADGRPIRSAVVEWQGVARPADAKAQKQSIPANMRMLMEVVTSAIEEAGRPTWPWGDKGARVQAAPDGAIRTRYYARVAEKADSAEDPRKLAERQRKSFNDSIRGAIQRKIIMASEIDSERWIWLP